MPDLSRENFHGNSLEKVSVSSQLDRVKERIMHVWEARVREIVSSASSKSVPVLRNQLPELLENLVSNISPGSKEAKIDEAEKIGREHGEQRASLLDYTFSQVLLEYRVLRQVIFEVLEEEKLQAANVRDTILDVLDAGIDKAIERFSIVRSEELSRSNRDLEHFAAIAAHDLKAPLATITGFAELLDESLHGKIELEEVEYIQAIKRSSARMTLLIERLLEYSSVGREVKPFEMVSVRQVLVEVTENLKITTEKLNAKVHVGELPTVFGDPSLLSQLFQNFISNALKFRHPQRDPEIRIEARDQGSSWLFSVQDNGIGFDPKNKEEIFSLFKQLSTAKDQGLGIGLATARKVVEFHGGRAWAESKLNEGSTFFFTIPKPDAAIRFH